MENISNVELTNNKEGKTKKTIKKGNLRTSEQESSFILPLNKKYVFSDKTLGCLETAFITGKNAILYGPGGHGKSELSVEFFQEKGINPFVLTMGKGMTIDKMLGGIDIKKITEEGKIEYLVENSFMNHEYVILEEMLDCDESVLEQLKDILSSKCLRNGSQVFPLKTQLVIALTNRDRNDFTKKDTSLMALMERFPLELEVKWETYNEHSYNMLLNTRFGKADELLLFILKTFSEKGHKISPRIAIDSQQIVMQCGHNSLTYIPYFQRQPALLKECLEKYKSREELANFEKAIMAQNAEFATKGISGSNDLNVLKKFIKEIDKFSTLYNSVAGMATPDDMSEFKAKLIKKAKETIKYQRDAIEEKIKIVKQTLEALK